MSPVFTAHRRAEEFAALVEGPSTAGTGSARYADLLELVAALRTTPDPVARPAFVAGLRERLLAEAATTSVPEETVRLTLPPRRRARERRIAAVVGGIAIVGASTSVAMASEQALPGDALYPVKRVIEDVHTRISLGDADKGHTVLTNASDRLDEVTALTRSSNAVDQVQVASTLDDFSQQAAQATDLLLGDYAVSGDRSSVSQLQDFAASSLDRLTAIEPLVPGAARDELVNAAKTILAIDAAVHQACPACGTGITEIPPVFAASAGTDAGSAGPGSGATGPASAGPRGSGGHHHATRSHHGTPHSSGPALPGLGQQPLPPGSVLGPSGGGQGGTQQGGQDPLGGLIGGITGGVTGGNQGGPSPAPSPSLPSLGDTLDGAVDGTVDGLGSAVDGATGGLTGGN